MKFLTYVIFCSFSLGYHPPLAVSMISHVPKMVPVMGYSGTPLTDSEVDKILEEASQDETHDSLEELNRIVFHLNRALDTLILKPVATLYDSALHQNIKDSLENVVDTTFLPSNAINFLLQGNLEDTMGAIMRLFFNVFFGFFGIFDVAKHLDLPAKKTTMNETLIKWGVPSGPYIMIPFIGPSTLRGSVGKIIDVGINPLAWMVGELKNGRIPWRNRLLAIYFLDLLQRRAKVLSLLNDIEKTSPDPYATIRNLFFQNEREMEKEYTPSE